MARQFMKSFKIKIDWTAAGVLVALGLGVVGILFSWLNLNAVKTSLQQSQNSLSILANKENVYLEPNIEVDSLMYKNSQLGAPKLFLFNNGRIEAINVVVLIIRRQFDGNSFIGQTWGSGEGYSYVFDEIKTFETKEIILPEGHIVDPEYNTLEVRVYFMREYDKKLYSYRTFYFYGPEAQGWKSWYNIKQAKLIEGHPFEKVINESLKLPSNLEDQQLRNIQGNELYEF